MVIFSFVAFLLLFVVIGLFSIRESRRNSVDYLLAGRNVPPWLVGLSAVATNNSGYMFIGLIGYTYAKGLSAIWMMIGWIAGDFLASLLVHRKLRETTERRDVHTFGGLLGHWHGTNYRGLRVIVGLVTLLFLGTYAAAQLSAGSKALQVLFGWEHFTGALIGAVIVLLYSFSGGIRASIWTDAAQSMVMIGAMALMVLAAFNAVGGLNGFRVGLAAVGVDYMALFPTEFSDALFPGGVLFVASWIFAGYGVVGQPHIMVRFMTMDDPKRLGEVRLYYYGWFAAFWSLAILAGLAARILLPQAAHFDAELALPMLARQLLPDVLVGVVLAGIFAATISTADSLILSCSASLTRDFHRQRMDHYLVTKVGTVAVTLAALAIALSGNKSVFELVLDSWGVLAAAFAPLLTMYALGQRPGEVLSIVTVVSGVAVVYGWTLYLPGTVYAVMPGILAGFLVFLIGMQVKKPILTSVP